MSELSERIKAAIEASGLSQRDIEIKTGIPQSAIQRYASGDTEKVPIKRIEAIAIATGTTAESLLGWEDSKPVMTIPNIMPISTQRIPMLGEIACGKPIICNEDRESYVEAGTNIHADFCLRCKGDSMTGARIFDGDIVFIRAQDTVDNGQIAAVIIDNEATLKRVYYYPEKAKLVLQAENPKYEPLVYIGEELNEIRILGKAISFQSDVV